MEQEFEKLVNFCSSPGIRWYCIKFGRQGAISEDRYARKLIVIRMDYRGLPFGKRRTGLINWQEVPDNGDQDLFS